MQHDSRLHGLCQFSKLHYSFEKGPGFHSLELLDLIHRVGSFRHGIGIARGEDRLKMDYKKKKKSGGERDGKKTSPSTQTTKQSAN